MGYAKMTIKKCFALAAKEISHLCERKAGLVAIDSLAVVLSASAAYLLGTTQGFPPRHLLIEGEYVFFMLAMRIPAFALAGVYKSIWKYGSASDVLRVARGMALSTAAAFVALLWLQKTSLIGPILLIDSLLVLCTITAIRFAAWRGSRKAPATPEIRTLVVGAGDAGEMVVRQMLSCPEHGYLPVGFLDDDSAKKGMTIHDVSVLGSCDDAGPVAKSVRAQTIVIATPAADGSQMRSIVDRCSAAKLPMKTVPAVKDILEGRVTVNHIRQVNVEDLIAREPVTHDRESISPRLKGKTVLVTGAAGSIGSELCRKVLKYAPGALVALDTCENGLYYLREELIKIAGACEFIPVVANTQCGTFMDRTLQKYRPHLVFHAAAHKHVPLMEDNPEEAIRNNVRGALNVMLACEKANVETVVNISTDKAVNPTSIMGASKRLIEMFIHDYSRTSKTEFCTVRFGNVLGSSGSVLPLFEKQIANGGPITITHPSIRRYFMTIPEAVSLVLQASSMAKGGEVFVLDMGEQMKISDLAKHLITLSGLDPRKDIEVTYTGLRPGEKMHEELWEPEERPCSTRHRNILAARPCGIPKNFHSNLRLLLHYADTLDRGPMMKLLSALLPSYSPRIDSIRSTMTAGAGAEVLAGRPTESDGTVRFTLDAPNASDVRLTGDFNKWDPSLTRMIKTGGKGVWMVDVPIDEGSYEYRYLVDGNWLEDPENPLFTINEHGGKNSVLRLGEIEGAGPNTPEQAGVGAMMNAEAANAPYGP